MDDRYRTLDRCFGQNGALTAGIAGYEPRPGQLAMARSVMEALEHDGTLIVEAPTGTGKTLAYLIPALLYDRRLVVSTKTKNLQEQIFFKDWPLLRDRLGFEAKIMVMKGRGNYLCRMRLHRFNQQQRFYSKEEALLFGQLHEWIMTTDTGDRAEVEWMTDNFPAWNEINSNPYACKGRKCNEYDNCFLMRMRRQASMADILIVNHHLFFADLALKAAGPGEVIPDYHAVIFDEAHELEDVATAFFARRISTWRVEELETDLVRALSVKKSDVDKYANIIKMLRAASDRFFERFRREGDQKYRLKPEAMNGEIFSEFHHFRERLGALAGLLDREKGDETSDLAGLARRADEMLADADMILNLEEEENVHYAEIRGRGIHLVAEPIEPAGRVRDALFSNVGPVVFTSATLSTGGNFAYFKSRLGIEFEVEEKILPTCFDYRTQGMFFIPAALPDPMAAGFIDAYADLAEQILNATRGRALLLFTSIRNMKLAYERLVERLPYLCMIQGEGSNASLLQRFREDTHSILFATASFWEGIDVVGEALSCVVIDKLPFASPGEPLIEARIETLNRNGGNAFFDYQVPQAIISLKQGLGRLIRHRTDRGLLVLTDGRMWKKGYGRKILASLPGFPVTGKWEDAAKFAKTLSADGKPPDASEETVESVLTNGNGEA